MQIFIFLVVLLFCTAVLIYNYSDSSRFVSIRSALDGKIYEVRDMPDTRAESAAADRLASIKKDINKLVGYLHSKNLPDMTTSQRLYDRWAVSELKETAESSKNIAYTINKGQEVHVCIRSADANEQFEDYNTTMFVVLHELAHIMSKSFGHQEEFKHNFTILLTVANKLGIYKLQNFNESPEMYCGTKIDNSPCSYNSCT